MGDGLSWCLICRLDDDCPLSSCELRRAECNAKIAVALAVMEEGLSIIVKHRSDINLIQNVVYNIGSNFSRLDFRGFYNFILEERDEIICTASVRIYGTRRAEIPFIVVRTMDGPEGNSTPFLDTIVSVLCSLGVEKLIIQATPELMKTCTSLGFKPLDISQIEEVKSLKMLVIPETALLQKVLQGNNPSQPSNEAGKTKIRTKVHHSAITSMVSDLVDGNFGKGSWETIELVSSDVQMKLYTDVFFASIDQRDESAAGESACAALAVVIAHWLQTNQGTLPTKPQFDCLIQQGSLEWKKLCDDPTYLERFPNKHFTIEAILEAEIRPVVSEKTIVAFFKPEAAGELLEGLKTFDTAWDEIRPPGSKINPNQTTLTYTVGWNDHFFVLKVDQNAYYLVDTLGERLDEGCKQGYILKFDERTSIHKIQSDCNVLAHGKVRRGSQLPLQKTKGDEDEELACRGKESCKEYMKSILAAIAIREAQKEITNAAIENRVVDYLSINSLQIEFQSIKTL